MFDSEDSSPPKCPFCRARSGCRHVLGVLDITSCEWHGGFLFDREEQVRAAIAERFRTLLAAPKLRRVTFKLETLQELWDELDDEAKAAGDDLASYLDGDVLNRLLIDLLEQDQGVDIWQHTNEGGPGESSLIATMHAKDPETAFLQMMGRLERALNEPAPATRRRTPGHGSRKRPKRKSRP